MLTLTFCAVEGDAARMYVRAEKHKGALSFPSAFLGARAHHIQQQQAATADTQTIALNLNMHLTRRRSLLSLCQQKQTLGTASASNDPLPQQRQATAGQCPFVD